MSISIRLFLIKRFMIKILMAPFFILKVLNLSFRLLKFSYINKKDSKIVKIFNKTLEIFLECLSIIGIILSFIQLQVNAIYKGLINLYRWFNIIWYDRYWDYGYYMDIHRIKLISMEKEFRKNDWASDHIQIADSIKEAIRLLDEWEEDDDNKEKREAFFNHVRDNIETWWD